MRNYIILNDINSNTINGLLIQELPPISKPKMRTQINEIDGRAGDIVTQLGYAAYTKTIDIGLYGDFDIDEIISYFNSSGTVVFSNEPDKYYNYEIIDQIDFKRLVRFKTAKVKMHVQPFKYPTEEETIEFEYQYIEASGTSVSVNNTGAKTFKEINLYGNTDQAVEKYNLIDNTLSTLKTLNTSGSWSNNVYTYNGVAYTVNGDGSITANGTSNSNGSDFTLLDLQTFDAGTYYLSSHETTTGGWYIGTYYNYTMYIVHTGEISINVANSNTTLPTLIGIPASTQINNVTFYPMLTTLSGKDYIPYEGKPTPAMASPINVVSGDNTINICGKNLLNTNLMTEFTPANATWYSLDGVTSFYNATNIAKSNLYFEIKSGVTYTWSINSYKNKNTGVNSPFQLVRPDASIVANIGQSDTSVTFTATENTRIYPRMSVATTGVATQCICQLEIGNRATIFEPYVSNTYPLNLPVENLFDKDNANSLNAYINSTNGSIVSNANSRLIYISCKPNTTYTLSKTLSARFIIGTCSTTPSNGVTCNSYQAGNDKTNLTITSGSSDVYLCVFYYNSSYDTLTEEQIRNSIQIELGSKANQYWAYGTTPIEMCKIGDYKDYFYKENDSWYLHKEIGKAIYNGTEADWSNDSSNKLSGIINNDIIRNTSATTTIDGYCNYYIASNLNNTRNNTNQYCIYSGSTTTRIYFNNNGMTLNEFKTWVGTHNLIAYYILDTPTTTEITDTTLIDQLDNLENAVSYEGQTNIYQENNNLGFNMEVFIFEKDTDKVVINNIGNIYSRPTLDIKGTGIVNVYLESNQMFQVDLSNTNEIVIDANEMEAYDPITQALMNRQVTGNYDNFKLVPGENTLKFSGELTKATITNYVRWL